MWTVIDVIAFNGIRGIAVDRVTDETIQFTKDDVKPQDVQYLRAGVVALRTPQGYIEHAMASYNRLYPIVKS